MRPACAGPATDPSNLLRVMPAEGGTMNGDCVRSRGDRVRGESTGRAPVREWLPAGADVIAADSGLRVANALGLHVNHLVGDLDSADPAAVEAAAAAGTTVDRHPAEKDATDLELALDAAVARGARRIVVVDGGGDRLDHLLGNLAAARVADVRGRAASRRSPARRGSRSCGAAIRRSRSAARSVATSRCCPVGGPARGIVTRGLRYRLQRGRPPAGHDARRQQRARRAHGLGRTRCRRAARGAAVLRRTVHHRTLGSRAMNRASRNDRSRRDRLDRRRVRQQRQERGRVGRPPLAKPPGTVVLLTYDSFAVVEAGAAGVHRRDRLQGEGAAAPATRVCS